MEDSPFTNDEGSRLGRENRDTSRHAEEGAKVRDVQMGEATANRDTTNIVVVEQDIETERPARSKKGSQVDQDVVPSKSGSVVVGGSGSVAVGGNVYGNVVGRLEGGSVLLEGDSALLEESPLILETSTGISLVVDISHVVLLPGEVLYVCSDCPQAPECPEGPEARGVANYNRKNPPKCTRGKVLKRFKKRAKN